MRKIELTKKQALIVIVSAGAIIIISGIVTGLKINIFVGVALVLYYIYRAVKGA